MRDEAFLNEYFCVSPEENSWLHNFFRCVAEESRHASVQYFLQLRNCAVLPLGRISGGG